MEQLKDHEGFINIGRQTADGARNIYFACNNFRKPSKVLYEISKSYEHRLKINYDIFKDKYWRSLDQFKS